jgi:hypothetical protein
MGTKAAKLILCASLFVIVLLTTLLAGGCSSTATQTPVSTTSISASNDSLNEWSIDSNLTQYLIKIATTSQGKQVFANLVDRWTHGTFQRNQDGSWLATMLIAEIEVKGNRFLEPIFENPVSQDELQYTMEWHVSADGLEFTPGNDNAKRLEAELVK